MKRNECSSMLVALAFIGCENRYWPWPRICLGLLAFYLQSAARILNMQIASLALRIRTVAATNRLTLAARATLIMIISCLTRAHTQTHSYICKRIRYVCLVGIVKQFVFLLWHGINELSAHCIMNNCCVFFGPFLSLTLTVSS